MDRREVLKTMAVAALAPMGKRMAGLSSVVAQGPLHIYLNQVGYLPGAEKVASVAIATVSTPAHLEKSFRVMRAATGETVLEGELGYPALDAASRDLVMRADFSKLREAGMYRLQTNGVTGDAFDVRPDVYADALRLTMRGYYGQRCGCKVDLGGGYAHPACHLEAGYHASSGKTGKFRNHGGWHDAGDYGRYVVNSGITCGTLLWAWELYPRALGRLGLGIPESGGKTPDYLAEIRWNLEWMLSLQDDDGGVWHKQTSEHFCGFVMPQNDHLTSYVIGTGAAPYKSTAATADLAAVMAIAARCYGLYDDTFAQRCRGAAERAWAWAMRNPAITFANPAAIATGGYDDEQLGDELLWASAELFRTTGKVAYEKAFLDAVLLLGTKLTITEPGWDDVASLGLWSYVLTNHATSPETRERIKAATRVNAQSLVKCGLANGYGNTMVTRDYVWGSNAVAANQSLLLLMAHHFEADTTFVDAALGNLHYLLGRNCLGVSWVTGLGARPFQHPHHRPSAADGVAAPWPGLLSGGPNRLPGDSVAEKLPKLPPMRMWADDAGAYSLNEIAINWNAPLVFVLAAANEMTQA